LKINEEDRINLLETAYGEAERLNRLVGNLLNMTRLEANAIHLRLEPCDIQDVIGAALDQLEDRLGKKPIVITLSEGLPMVPLDFALFGQVLVNVLDNAIKYSPKDTQIDIDVSQSEKEITIRVSDRGIGIPDEDLERIFDKFYRVSRPENIVGTGLGLAICKGIVETIGGKISAGNRESGGTVITITLPKGNEP
jgi:two-component system sensor histidine kinase KdpD